MQRTAPSEPKCCIPGTKCPADRADSRVRNSVLRRRSPQEPAVALGSGAGRVASDLIISLAISAFIIMFLYQPVKVEGTSMMPSLEDQERIFVNKFVYRLEPIDRGDIVVFRYPRDPSKSYIKRVIGMAGTAFASTAARCTSMAKRWMKSTCPPAYTDARSYPEITVPPDSYFVLGDHRSMSNDSRDFGPVNQSFIYGKAVFGYWPMDKLGRVR